VRLLGAGGDKENQRATHNLFLFQSPYKAEEKNTLIIPAASACIEKGMHSRPRRYRPNESRSGQNPAHLKKRIYHFAWELLRGSLSPLYSAKCAISARLR
jgi:hypothetical protein